MGTALAYEVITTEQIPYGAGYNHPVGTETRKLYIDSRIPETFKSKTTGLVNVHKYLEIHEFTEEVVEDEFDLRYQPAHAIATAAEHAALKQDGHDPDEYEAFLKPFLAECEKTFSRVPRDLDLQPYVDMKATELLKRIRSSWGQGEPKAS